MQSNTRSWGPGTSAVVRALVAAEEPQTQVQLAECAGVSQPRVSQVLSSLAEAGAVQAADPGYVGDADRLIDLYLERHRPQLSEPESTWYGLDSVRAQASAIVRCAVADGAPVAISADVGPDLLVPWRHPTVIVVYTDRPLDLTRADLVPAEGRSDATALMRTTADRTLLHASPRWPTTREGLPLADPVQQLWDLLDLGGEDRLEAAGRLRSSITDRTLTTQQ